MRKRIRTSEDFIASTQLSVRAPQFLPMSLPSFSMSTNKTNPLTGSQRAAKISVSRSPATEMRTLR